MEKAIGQESGFQKTGPGWRYKCRNQLRDGISYGEIERDFLRTKIDKGRRSQKDKALEYSHI